jgi:hypothetical protein
MQSVSDELITLVKKLQQLPSLESFSLGGGTNLALRYQHRKSDDIDLFSDKIIGKEGYELIKNELKKAFRSKIISFDYPCDENDQFIFARIFISQGTTTIKIELLQNMKVLEEIERIDDIQMISKLDIGLFKLVSASNRFARKDIYDLHYITDEIELIDLFSKLKVKKELFNSPEDQTIFDLDEELCPLQDPSLLLKFDELNHKNKRKPAHSNDEIIAFRGSNWNIVRFNWRNKVRELYTKIGYNYNFNH